MSEQSPSVYIQYKGFDVCCDIRCECGEDYHLDAWFAYYVTCPKCGAIYRMPGAMHFDPLERVGCVPDGAVPAIVLSDDDD